MKKLVGMLVLVSAIGIGTVLVTNSNTNLQSNAETEKDSNYDFGLKAYADPPESGKITNIIHVSWNPIENPPSGASLRLTIRSKPGESGILNGSNPASVNFSETSRDLTDLNLEKGTYYIQLRMTSPGQTPLKQTYSLSIPQSEPISENLFTNSSFEDGIIPSTNNDLDPIGWEIKEGKFALLENGGETGNVIEEHPRMTQTVMKENTIRPRTGLFMLKNATKKGLKSQFRQTFKGNGAIDEGTLIWKISLYIPVQSGFTQQMELRRGLELTHTRWTESYTDYCWTYAAPENPETNPEGKRICKKGPAISQGVWHTYESTLTKIDNNKYKWKYTLTLDGKKMVETDGTTNNPYVTDKFIPKGRGFGQIFVGDECMKGSAENPCDGYGTVYYDDVEAYNILPVVSPPIITPSPTPEATPTINPTPIETSGITATMTDEKLVYSRPDNKNGGYFPDGKYFTYKFNNKYSGVIPGSLSYTTSNFVSPSITSISQIPLSPTPNTFDSNGVWTQGIIPSGNKLFLFYHGENGQTLSKVKTKNLSSIGYATSTNGGLTWKKSPEIVVGGIYKNHSADIDVKNIGEYLYMWFAEAVNESTTQTVVARSKIADEGRPGTWKKYYCQPSSDSCGFTEPGVGGKSTALNLGEDPFISYNTFLGKYIAVGCPKKARCFTNGDSESRPLVFYVSDDLINWQELLSTPLLLPPHGRLRFHFSIIGEDGSSEVSGKSFWVYYLYSSDWNIDMYRRKITLSKSQ